LLFVNLIVIYKYNVLPLPGLIGTLMELMNRRLVRFIGAGIVNTIVDFGILNVLVFVFHTPEWLANTVSVSTAITVSYLLNHYFVFKSTQQHSVKHIGKFVLITLVGIFVVQDGGLYILLNWVPWFGTLAISIVHGLGITQLSDEFIRLNTAKIVLAFASLAWNYTMYKRFVFTEPADSEEPIDIVV